VRQFIIYKVTNQVNGKVYIGQTAQSLRERKAQHLNYAKRGDGFYFHRAINKYGTSGFTWTRVSLCSSKAEADRKEIALIALLRTKVPDGYNLTDGGEGVLGLICSEETRAKKSKALKGHKPSEETKAKLSEAKMGNTNSLGFKHTEETRAQRSKTLKMAWAIRKQNGTGKHTLEAKAKISKALTGRKKPPLSEETKAKISRAGKGKKRSDETKDRMSKSRKGFKHTEETKAKMRGIIKTDEHRANLSIAAKRAWEIIKQQKGDYQWETQND